MKYIFNGDKKWEKISHPVFGVLDDHEDGRLDFGHLAEHGVERESVLRGGEDQGPGVALGPGRQVTQQARPVRVGEDLGGAQQLRQPEHVEVEGAGVGAASRVQRAPQLLAHRQHLQRERTMVSTHCLFATLRHGEPHDYTQLKKKKKVYRERWRFDPPRQGTTRATHAPRPAWLTTTTKNHATLMQFLF